MAYLGDLGIHLKPQTLAVYAVRRKGPPHRLIAKRAVYVANDIRKWTEQQFEQGRRHV